MGTSLQQEIQALLQRHEKDDEGLTIAILALLHSRPRPMTARQREVATMLLEGCDGAEMAKRMSISRRTVKAYFNQLFRRYGISETSGRGRMSGRVRLALLLYRRQEQGEAW